MNDFSILTEMKDAEFELNVSDRSESHMILKFSAYFKKKTVPEAVRIEWKVPVGDIVSVWAPLVGFSRYISPNWRRTKCESKTAVGAPVLSLVNHDGTNAHTVAVSDAKTPIVIGAGVSEEEAVFFCNVTFFTAYVSPIDHYEAYIRLDFERKSFVDSVKKVNEWWEQKFGYRKAYVPQIAYLPMNSTWYSFHQELNAEKLLEECRLSAELGMKTLIIDDGWQTVDSKRGYRYCGDWELATEKIADMKALTEEIHKLGVRVMLWFSVPFVGIHSNVYERFKGMSLKEEKGALILDLRYKEVRDYLVNVYVKSVKQFGLDGLKLDFIDRFCLSEESPAVNESMDISSVEDALEALLLQTKTELLKIDPEFMLEFRQSYMGPTVLKYGNMIRVRDCPHDSMRNRTGIVDLRLTSGKTAVHSDMVMWSKDAPVEVAARQLIGTLFGVPQVSVLLKELSHQHVEAIRFWLDFYTKNMEILHSSALSVKNPELGYSQVTACKDGSMIGVNYANVPFELETFEGEDGKYTLINSSDGERVFIFADKALDLCDVRIYNCLGEEISEYTKKITAGAAVFNVPVCGFVEITKGQEDRLEA